MKKILFPLLAICLLMASCIEDKGNHLTQIVSPNGMAIVYADQPSDTLYYQTTEQHTLTTNVNWMRVQDDIISQIKFKDEMVWLLTIPVLFDPNTTGEWRSAGVKINAGDYSAGAYFAQAPYLNVTRPTRYINGNTLEVIQYGPLADSAFVTVDSISFTTYGDWTLSVIPDEINQLPQDNWISPVQTSGTPGKYTVLLNMQPNESTSEDRNASLLLTSSGVNDTIPVLQYKRRVWTE